MSSNNDRNSELNSLGIEARDVTHSLYDQMPNRMDDINDKSILSARVPRVKERYRVQRMKDLGFDTGDEFIDGAEDSQNEQDHSYMEYAIMRQRRLRLCLIFTAMFVLSMIAGLLIATFWHFSILIGFGIGAGAGAMLFLLPMIVCLLTKR